MVVRVGFVVGGTRGARVLGGATTPLVTSFVGGDILDTGPSTVTAGCGETVSAWFATRCNQIYATCQAHYLRSSGTLYFRARIAIC